MLNRFIRAFGCPLLPVLVSVFSFPTLSESNCHQGIRGYVYKASGNQMPSPDIAQGAPKGIKTTIYIYRLTNLTDVVRQGTSPFYTKISTEFVKKTETDASGHFKTKLKPGKYSLFVKKDDLFFASRFDEKNNISPVEVKAGQMADVVFTINYGVSY